MPYIVTNLRSLCASFVARLSCYYPSFFSRAPRSQCSSSYAMARYCNVCVWTTSTWCCPPLRPATQLLLCMFKCLLILKVQLLVSMYVKMCFVHRYYYYVVHVCTLSTKKRRIVMKKCIFCQEKSLPVKKLQRLTTWCDLTHTQLMLLARYTVWQDSVI